MNFLKKGPELKLSEVRVPGFLQDVYYDLKDRHLLPVVAILLVAIVVVPIVISSSGSEAGSPSEAITAEAAQGATSATESAALVAKSAPPLRDYRRRLDHKQAKDPFRAPPASPEPSEETGGGAPAAGSGGGGSTPESGGSAPASSESPSPAPEPEPLPPPSTEEPGEPDTLRYFSYAIDVRVSAGGKEGEQRKATVRRNLPELTMLPSRETPAIVYMGSTKDGKKAVMTVSSDVEAIFGDAKCILGSDRCQLLIMEPGLPVNFVYGGAGRTYKIELLKVHLLETDELNKAPLGKPKHKQKQSEGDEKGARGGN